MIPKGLYNGNYAKGGIFISSKKYDLRIAVSSYLHERLKQASIKKGVPMATLVKFAINEYLSKGK